MREYTIIFRDGIQRGLRKTEKNPRNSQALTKCQGAFPEDGVVHALDDLQSAEILSSIDAEFPFPQIFALSMVTLVCTATKIYEYASGNITPVFEDATEGSTWTVADYGRFIVLTNGAILVVKDAQTGDYEEYTFCDIPNCICVADVNGQMFVGAPGITVSAGYMG
jgi:hypothetical protein